jgi:hypothetical protein
MKLTTLLEEEVIDILKLESFDPELLEEMWKANHVHICFGGFSLDTIFHQACNQAIDDELRHIDAFEEETTGGVTYVSYYPKHKCLYVSFDLMVKLSSDNDQERNVDDKLFITNDYGVYVESKKLVFRPISSLDGEQLDLTKLARLMKTTWMHDEAR